MKKEKSGSPPKSSASPGREGRTEGRAQGPRYDWIVMGDHPGALLSAGMAARLGLSVLILPESARPSPYVAPSDPGGGGHCLDYETNSLLGLGRAAGTDGLLRECLRRLELPASDADAIRDAEPMAQVLGPSFRVGFAGGPADVERSIERELGSAAPGALGLGASWQGWGDDLLKYWHALPDRFSLIEGIGPTAKRKKRLPSLRIADVWKAAPPVSRAEALNRTTKEFMGGAWLSVAGAESSDFDRAKLAHLAAVARSAASFRGGLKAYRETLLRLAKRLGARVETGAVAEIRSENGYFAGVRLQGGEDRLGAGGVLGTGLSVGGAWGKRLRDAPRPQGWKFTVLFEADAAAIPPGATSRLVWKEQGAPGLELEVVDPSDYAVRGERRKFIFARAILPWSRESLSPTYQRMVAARMRRQVNEIFPFFDRHLRASFPEFESPTYAEKLAALYPFRELPDVPESLRAYAAEDGVGPRSGVEGLFVVSAESYPELGTLGPTVAAIEAVTWLAHRTGLAGPFA